MGFIQKYILPKEIDFDHALTQQAIASRNTVQDLCRYCMRNDIKALEVLLKDEHNSRSLKRKNMRELLNVFITPYDKESIYRMITQLDWISLSVKHLAIDILAYKVTCPEDYAPIFDTLIKMSTDLTTAMEYLPKKELGRIMNNIEAIHDNYDETSKACALAATRHLKNDEIRVYLAQKEILQQLKEVARRIHVSANTLEDMALKIV